MDVHYLADEEYKVKHEFWPPEGDATCIFGGFWLLFPTFFTTTFISEPYDDLIMIKTIDEMYTLSEPNCVHMWPKIALLGSIWPKMKLILHLLYHSMYDTKNHWLSVIMYSLSRGGRGGLAVLCSFSDFHGFWYHRTIGP